MKKSNLFILSALGLLVAVSLGWIIWQKTRPEAGKVAQIYQGGTLLQEIDLNQVEQPQTITVEGPNGAINSILVERGRISIVEASCPDQVCVRQGWISNGAVPITCLPNQVLIQIVGGEDELDVIAG